MPCSAATTSIRCKENMRLWPPPKQVSVPFTAVGRPPHLRTVLGRGGHSPATPLHHWRQRGQLNQKNADGVHVGSHCAALAQHHLWGCVRGGEAHGAQPHGAAQEQRRAQVANTCPQVLRQHHIAAGSPAGAREDTRIRCSLLSAEASKHATRDQLQSCTYSSGRCAPLAGSAGRPRLPPDQKQPADLCSARGNRWTGGSCRKMPLRYEVPHMAASPPKVAK